MIFYLMIYLYQDVSRLMYNIQMRGRSYEQNIKPEYLEKVQRGYLNFIEQNTMSKVLILDVKDSSELVQHAIQWLQSHH